MIEKRDGTTSGFGVEGEIENVRKVIFCVDGSRNAFFLLQKYL